MKVITKKKGKKILAFVLALLMVLGIIPASYESKAAEPMLKDTEIFTDTFDNGSTWNSAYWNYTTATQVKYYGVRNGTAPLGNQSNGNDSARNMYKTKLTDVHVKADVCVTSAQRNWSSKTQYHLLFARGEDGTATNSIAFGFKTGYKAEKSSLVVAKYNHSDTPTILYETEATYSIDATGTNAYTLELYVIGTQVIAKCEGTTIYSASVDSINQSAGYCGILDRRAANKLTSSSLSNSSVYGTDYTKNGYFDNFYLATVEEVVADGFRINGPVVVKADGTGVADITLISGGNDSDTKEDVAVTVAGLENKPVGLYEGEYTVTATIGGQPKTATATRVFIVDDLNKTVTNMSDNRWTGASVTVERRFTVDANGVATLTPSGTTAAGLSVLNVGTENGAYGNFYAEYTLTVSELAEEARGYFDTIFCIDSYGATGGNAWAANLFYDNRASQAPNKTFWGRLKGATTTNFSDTKADEDIGVDKPVTIGMLVYDKTITLLINGEQVATYTGVADLSGWFGIAQSSNVGKGAVKNFVYIPLEKKVISVEFDAPEAVVQGDTVEVKATPTYNWPYGVGEQTTVGVALEGLDTSTAGEKTYTASFGGIQKQLTITVTKKPDGFRVNGPIVMTKDGKGVADVTILAGTSALETKEDVEVNVTGLSNPDTGLYEGSYEVATLVYGVMRQATASRVFVVDDLSKTVTNMSDSRWTGETVADAPNFTVDETGKATLTNKKYSVLSMGENDATYNEFYAEYTLNLSDIAAGKRNWYSTCFNIGTRASYSTGFTGDILHDLRDGREVFYTRLQQRQGNKELGSYAKGTTEGDVAVGDSMRIGLLVYDNVITYTLNGNVVGTYTYQEGTEASKGWLALYNDVESNSKATVENFIYVPIGEKVIQDIAFSYPEKVLPGASVEVSAVPVYNWPYGEGEAVTEGVVVTGLDTSTLGEKTFKASYGGVEKTLQLVVSNTLFEEDFDGTLDDLTDNGWGNVSKTTAALKEEKLYLLGNQEGLYATEVIGSDAWTNYTVKADVMITTNGNSANTNVASLVARSTGLTDGYEWSLCVNKDGTSYVRLYDRAAKKQLIKVDYPVDLKEVYTMKLTVVGNIIKGYINGEKIIETASASCATGSVGVRRNGYGVYYDNLIVTLPEEDAPVSDVSKQQVWFTDTFESESTMAERGWDIDGTIQNGELVLTHKNATAFLTQIPGSSEWTDYTAQAKITVVDSDEISSVNNSVSALIVRSTSGSTGYEFGVSIMASDDKGGFRLYNRTTKETLASTTDVVAERGKTYQLTAVVEGNRIRCFVDGQLVFDVTDSANSNPTGYVGLRTVGYSGAYDDIVVRKVTDADRKGIISGSAISPVTGDVAMSLYIPVVAMVVAMAVMVFCVRRRLNTNK